MAADRQGVNLTEFIMLGACEKAEQSLADPTRFVLDDKQWKAFMAALDRPAKVKPRFRQLFKEQNVSKAVDERDAQARVRDRQAQS